MNNIIVTGITNYVANKRKLKDTPVMFSSEGMFYYHEGKLIEAKEFEEMFKPVLIPINYKGENPDGTKVK